MMSPEMEKKFLRAEFLTLWRRYMSLAQEEVYREETEHFMKEYRYQHLLEDN